MMEITRPVLARRTGQWSLRGIGRQTLFYGPIALFLAITFLPIYWILLSAFTPISQLFQLFQRLSLVDSLNGLFILFVSFLLPTSVWIMTSFIRQIPLEMEEAAQVDGASFPTILLRVIVPVLRPALATLFLIDLIT